ncbi:MAG: ATP-binding protein [Chloroflexi bacterium]|nr:ATP-binding protein [Chloroflexota bacterium]
MIERPVLKQSVQQALRRSPVVALVGPRQCGKTTLARELAKGRAADYFDLEDPVDLARLTAPQLALADLKGLVVIDEIQRRPDLFGLLRVLADRRGTPARFLLLGSASPALMRGVSESLAGRVRFIDMGGFDLVEVGVERVSALWLRGGFPRSLLARSETESLTWRNEFIRTFLERDIPQLAITIPAQTLRRFWSMIAHFHGQIWSGVDFARSLDTSQPTARRYLDILSGAYVVRQLPPWFENIGKRQVKSPKVYIRDSGLLHALLSLRTRKDLMAHPKYGASWEGFAIEQVLSLLRPAESYFWATHSGAELDLLVPQSGKRLGFEMKVSDAPTLTRSMAIAMEDLSLSYIYVVYPGTRSYRLARKIEVVSIRDLPAALR